MSGRYFNHWQVAVANKHVIFLISRSDYILSISEITDMQYGEYESEGHDRSRRSPEAPIAPSVPPHMAPFGLLLPLMAATRSYRSL